MQSIGDDKIDRLSKRSIHVAGTKGKGSTAAITESIIRHHGFSTGLYTSPHLITVRERIKIRGEAISEELFVKYFWQTWDLCEAAKTARWNFMPGWFRFLTLLAFRAFQEENLDCTVFEVGMGGLGDATNVLTTPAACGITYLDYDHTEVLGNTLKLIAGQKAGIFKLGIPAVTVPQEDEAYTTLQQFAIKTPCPLYLSNHINNYIDATNAVDSSSESPLNIHSLNLNARFLQTNASIAIALSDLWLTKNSTSYKILHNLTTTSLQAGQTPEAYPVFPLSNEFVNGISKYHWPGRAQQLSVPLEPITLFLDGAHTAESIRGCIKWFNDCSSKSIQSSKVLFFNCNPPRDPKVLLLPLVAAIAENNLHLDFVYFTMSQLSPHLRKDPSNDISYATYSTNSWQKQMANIWNELITSAKSRVHSPSKLDSPVDQLDEFAPSTSQNEFSGPVIVWPTVKVVEKLDEGINDVKEWIHSSGLGPTQVDILVTGSLYLVGAVLEMYEYPTHK